MHVSIIIVNYNTKPLTVDCVDSIINKTIGIDYEIILVDNASSDGSQEFFANDARIKFIEAGRNLGFGKANNLGVQQAKGDYIFFLNSDTLLLNNAIYEMWRYCEEHKEDNIGGLGCILCDGNNQRCHSYAKLNTWKDIVKSYFLAPYSKNKAKEIIAIDSEDEGNEAFEVGYVTGADLFVSRKVIDECGCFDPDFFMYSEESEMQWRFRKHGYHNMIIKSPKIMHLEGMSQTKRKSPTMRKIMMTQSSLYLYVKKTSSKFEYLLFQLLFPITRLPFLLLSKRSVRDKVVYVKMFFVR